MPNNLTIAFFGHRYIDNQVKVQECLEKIILNLIDDNEYVNFLIGRNGEFDQCVSSVIRRLQKNHRDDNNAFTLVLPYPTAEYMNNKECFDNYYNDVEIFYKASKPHPKSAIQKRNCEMVERADLIICYIKENTGGAVKTVRYAHKKNKTVINIAEML